MHTWKGARGRTRGWDGGKGSEIHSHPDSRGRTRERERGRERGDGHPHYLQNLRRDKEK